MRSETSRNTRGRIISGTKSWLLALLRWALIIGVSYVIVSPLLGVAARSFFSNTDQFNPMVYMIPQTPTLERYQVALKVMSYASVLPRNLLFVGGLAVIQAIVCSMVGYGFARFRFPLKGLLFGCLIIMIVMPSHVIMLPLYMLFQRFDPLGIVTRLGLTPPNLLASPWPMYIMTVFGAGLRSGLYIYIFTQFFRGLPKEIEEAAEIDGAGAFYTYLRVMLPNAIPSALTVLIFSVVWQFNDKFYAQLFSISPRIVLSKQISGLQASVSNLYQLRDPSLTTLYLYAGVMLAIVPLLVLYVILQRRFIEGVERSGIVG
ncbi:MAG: carbohydrate ABC transporter permease [Oscillospiraceae bacterium]|nr:carbohydrate ABC transporter permease [Oscillospiraceae bacterium]